MKLLFHAPELVQPLHHALLESDLVYGDSKGYGSLLAPVSVCLTHAEAENLSDHFLEVWGLYRTWNLLYSQSIKGDAPSWISRMCESGLSTAQIPAQRITATALLEPKIGRVDYLVTDGDWQIAEVQWTPGGPGLFFGISAICGSVFPFNHEASLGELHRAFFELILASCNKTSVVAVNAVRDVWLNGEQFLVRRNDSERLTYVPISRGATSGKVYRNNTTWYVRQGKHDLPIDFFYGHGVMGHQSERTLLEMATASCEGRLWIEAPLNNIYKQKWGLALPFMPEFGSLFTNRLRSILIPTVLLNVDSLDLSCVIASIRHKSRDRLSAITSLDQISQLPESLRKHLIMKCGAGVEPYYCNGRGVYRLSGSRKVVRAVLDFVGARIDQGEPWILQPYVGDKTTVPVSAPWASGEFDSFQAHARLMIFGGRVDSGNPKTLGGLANYGDHWKVNGRFPTLDSRGRLSGTAFTDMRVSV